MWILMPPRGWTRKSARLRSVSRRCAVAKRIVRAARMVLTGTPIGKRMGARVHVISDVLSPPSRVNRMKRNGLRVCSATTDEGRMTDDEWQTNEHWAVDYGQNQKTEDDGLTTND